MNKKSYITIAAIVIISVVAVNVLIKLNNPDHRTFKTSKNNFFYTTQFAEMGKDISICFNLTTLNLKINTTYTVTINDEIYNQYFTGNIIRDIYLSIYDEKCPYSYTASFSISVNDYVDDEFLILIEYWENSTRLDYFLLQGVSFI